MSARNPGRTSYVLSASLLGAYGLNVLAGKGIAKFGWTLPHAGDVAEFLAVFAAMIFFVIGLLLNERTGAPASRE